MRISPRKQFAVETLLLNDKNLSPSPSKHISYKNHNTSSNNTTKNSSNDLTNISTLSTVSAGTVEPDELIQKHAKVCIDSHGMTYCCCEY